MGFGKVKAAIVGARDVGKGVKWLEMTPAPYTPPPPRDPLGQDWGELLPPPWHDHPRL